MMNSAMKAIRPTVMKLVRLMRNSPIWVYLYLGMRKGAGELITDPYFIDSINRLVNRHRPPGLQGICAHVVPQPIPGFEFNLVFLASGKFIHPFSVGFHV